jgi:predicted anti-sigma-YlaC factor YlaD
VNCREVEGVLGADLDGELEPAVTASVQGHVDVCAACRQCEIRLGRCSGGLPADQPRSSRRSACA